MPTTSNIVISNILKTKMITDADNFLIQQYNKRRPGKHKIYWLPLVIKIDSISCSIGPQCHVPIVVTPLLHVSIREIYIRENHRLHGIVRGFIRYLLVCRLVAVRLESVVSSELCARLCASPLWIQDDNTRDKSIVCPSFIRYIGIVPGEHDFHLF